MVVWDTVMALVDVVIWDTVMALVDVVVWDTVMALVEQVTGVLLDPCAQTVKEVLVHPLAVEAVIVDALQVLHFRAYLALPLTTQAVNAVRRNHRKACASGPACGPVVARVNHLSLISSL